MGFDAWAWGLKPPLDANDEYRTDLVWGVGVWQVSADGTTITNLATGDTYDLTNIGSGGGGSTDTHTAISDDGSELVSSVGDINFASLLDATADGDGSVTVTGTDTHVSVSDDGTEVTGDPSDINLGSLLSVTDDGDGSVTVDAAAELARETIAASGQVASANAATVRTIEIADGQTYELHSAGLLLADGKPAPTDLDLVIATLDNTGGATRQTIVVDGDGTKQNDLSGSPLASYANSSGSTQTVAVMVDNGQFNAGTGSKQDIAAHFEEVTA